MIESPTLPASPTHPCRDCGAIGAHCHVRQPIDANVILRYIDWLLADTSLADATSWNKGAVFTMKHLRDRIVTEAKIESLAQAILHDNV